MRLLIPSSLFKDKVSISRDGQRIGSDAYSSIPAVVTQVEATRDFNLVDKQELIYEILLNQFRYVTINNVNSMVELEIQIDDEVVVLKNGSPILTLRVNTVLVNRGLITITALVKDI